MRTSMLSLRSVIALGFVLAVAARISVAAGPGLSGGNASLLIVLPKGSRIETPSMRRHVHRLNSPDTLSPRAV